jgi:uncharacterized metal-binding protein YceD (DUF177 family)
LALPSVPLHDLEQCSARGSFATKANDKTAVTKEQGGEKPNPFAVLEKLRNKE